MAPYRTTPEEPAARAQGGADAAMVFGLGLLVLASAVRVIAAFVDGETFGTEATLAFLVLFVTTGWGLRAAGAALRARWLKRP